MKNLIFKLLVNNFLKDPDKLQAFLKTLLGNINLVDRPILTFVLDALKSFVDNDEVWAILYEYLLALINGEESVEAIQEKLNDVRIVGAAKPGMDPATWMMIITAIVEVIKLWRERRKDKENEE